MQANRNRIFLIFGIIGFFIVMILLTVLTSSSRSKDDITVDPNALTGKTIITGITTRVVPTEDTIIKINDAKVDEGSIELEPGTYTVTATHNGFRGESRTVTLKQGDRVDIGFILTSSSASTADYYDKHPDDIAKAQGITGQKSEAAANTKIVALPLLKELPRKIPHRYSITYGQSLKSPNDTSASIIYIEYVDEAAKTAANNWIKYQGYDPAQLETSYNLNAGL